VALIKFKLDDKLLKKNRCRGKACWHE